MFFGHLKLLNVRFVMILALVAGMLGITPVRTARADTIVVTNAFDSGPGSLRQAILDAAAESTITFDPTLAGEFIFLFSQLTINKNLTIDGSAVNPPLTLRAGNAARIMQVDYPADVTISGLILSGGTVNGNGGAVYASGSFTAINSTFLNNRAAYGGALWGGQIRVINSTFSGNQAVLDGGAITSVSLHIESSTITGNKADHDGGALSIWGDGAFRIVNSTIFQNQAGNRGGGMFLTGYPIVNIYNSTFAENTAVSGHEFSLGTIYQIALKNTIFVCNGEKAACYVTAGQPILNTNSILGIGTIQDYGLSDPGDNGGPTETMALLPDSPLIDAGDDAACANAPVNNLDQRGVARPQGSHCDIGAYEDQPLVRYVKQDATGMNNGTSWENAYTNLESALAAGSPDEEIWVAAGTYKPTWTTARMLTFHLKNGVAVYGGFVGTETSRAQRNHDTNLTVLSGDIGAQSDMSDNSYHVVNSSGTNNSTLLDGFTIKAGNANGDLSSPSLAQGGGLYNFSGSPTIRNVIFTGNSANFGGGMHSLGINQWGTSKPILQNVSFIDNSAIEGGGMRNWEYSHAILEDVVFQENSVTRAGGGLLNGNYSSPDLTNVIFSDNTAGDLGGGGGIFNWNHSNPILKQVTFNGNTASWGGGMGNDQSSPSLTNVTFSGNSTATFGGGISNENNSSPTLTHVTVSGNSAGTFGGGVYNSSYGSNTTIYNSIFYNNSGGEIYNVSGTANVAFSIVQGGYVGTGNIDENPLLSPLQDNGGFTQTMALGDGSPAINAADDSYCPSTDQRGFMRPEGSGCDIGAYEYGSASVLWVVTNTNNSGPGSLRQAISDAAGGDTITFDSSLTGGTIILNSQLTIDKDLTIDASGLSFPLTLSGGNVTRIMEVIYPAGVTVSGLIFTEGLTNNGNGGAVNSTGVFVATDSSFIKNSASGNGGAISGIEITLTNSTLSDNTAGGSGGALYSGHLTIRNTTIDGNQANNSGGAITFAGNNLSSVVNSTITGNRAGSGGAIFSGGNSYIDIINSTFAKNLATTGHEFYLSGNGATILTNTAFVCTEGSNDCYMQSGNTTVNPVNSILGVGSLSDYGLAELAKNGGPTKTMALLPGSPLMDSGEDVTCQNAPVDNLDQRGMTRPQGSHCDIGAYEASTTLTVTKTADTNDGVCSSDCSLREAMIFVSPQGTIKFDPSLAGQTIWLASELVIDKQLVIDGSALATHITISGDTDNDGTGNVRVFTVNQNIKATLIQLTIAKGRASYGGGVYNFGSLTVIDSTFSGNLASTDGGGIYSFATLSVVNSVFSDNTSSQYGGGISASITASITNVEKSTFSNNRAFREGGAIHSGGTLTVTKSSFSGNSAAEGGGIKHTGTLTVTDSTFDSNSASFGGAIDNAGASTTGTIFNSTFSNNSAISGGAIENSGILTMTNSTLFDNSAQYGGGIRNDTYFSLTLLNSTFSNNKATRSGGGVYNGSWGTLNFVNTIIANSTSGGDCVNLGATGSNTSNLVEDGSCSASMQGDPNLGSLMDNGGFTQTMALSVGSPAIDTGQDANCPATDQRGVSRPQRTHCDIGAYEYGNSTVDVVIGDTMVGSYLLSPQESQRHSYTGVNGGPVKANNIDGASIMAAERVIYKVKGVNTSFSEMMGLPASQLDNIYWLPWYNNVDLDTQLRFANVTDQPATVMVTIGGVPQTPINLAAGESTRKSFAGINNGPVKIESTQNIVASERVIYKVSGVNTSFTETMALPASQLDTIYWLPWYNNVDLDTQLRIANVSGSQATVTVTIGGVPQPPFNLAAGASTRVSYPGLNNGPVKIVSTQNIVAAERVIYKVKGVNTSFTEMMAQPANQMNQTYWLPWYNNVDLDTQLRIANVSGSSATVTVTIGGVPQPSFNLAAGESTRISFDAINNGPVKIESTQNIVVAERVIYKVKGINTSFSEMMGLPDNLLDTTYWFPWYNNVDLDTQLRFGIP